MMPQIEEYGVLIDMGGAGDISVQRHGTDWIANHVSYSQDHSGLIGEPTTWAGALAVAVEYANQWRKPRP